MSCLGGGAMCVCLLLINSNEIPKMDKSHQNWMCVTLLAA